MINGIAPSHSAAMVAVDRAAADLRRGSFVVIEGDGEFALAQAAENVTTASLAALCRVGNGETSLALTANRASVLKLPAAGASVITLRLTEAIDAQTIRYLVDPTFHGSSRLPDAVSTQSVGDASCASAAIRLSKLAQLLPAAITAPLAGDPAERIDLAPAKGEVLRVGAHAIADYPRLAAAMLRPVSEARVPLEAAENARVVGFRPSDGGIEQFAIVVGDPAANQPALCRLHSECFTGDLLGSLRCDCGPQLQAALRQIGAAGHGVLLYLAHEGRGIGLINKLRAYQLQDAGFDTVDANHHLGFEADERSFQAAAIMLQHLGIRRVRLMTNNPAKVGALAREGIEVIERVPHTMGANRHNKAYLATKARRSGHLLDALMRS